MDAAMPYVWALILLSSIIAETLTRKLIPIWLAPAAAIALILHELECDVWLQALVFFILSAATITAATLLRRARHLDDRNEKGPEATIGKSGYVIEQINNLAGRGQVEVDGEFWAARAMTEEVTFEAGEKVEIIAVEGVKLICKQSNA